MRIYEIAKQYNELTLMKTILNAKNIPQICKLSKMVHSSVELKRNECKEWRIASQVHHMLQLLGIKYDQCPAFAEEIGLFVRDGENIASNKLILEATTNLFWGCGIDLSVIEKREKDKNELWSAMGLAPYEEGGGEVDEEKVKGLAEMPPLIFEGHNVLGWTLMIFAQLVKIKVHYGGLLTDLGASLEKNLREKLTLYYCNCFGADKDYTQFDFFPASNAKIFLWSTEELCALSMFTRIMHHFHCSF